MQNEIKNKRFKKLQIITIIVNLFASFVFSNPFINGLIAYSQGSQTFNRSATPLVFSGNATLSGQLSNRDLSSLLTPQNNWMLDLNPTLTIYGVPLALSILLSSQQNSIRQNINSSAVSVNVNTFQMQQDIQKQFILQLQTIQELRALSREMGFEKLRDSLMQNDPNKLPDLARMRELDKIDTYREIVALERKMGFEALRDSLEKNSPEKLADLTSLYKNPNKITQLENLQNGTPPQTFDEAQKMGLTQTSQDFISSFPTFSAGAVYPTYSQQTVSGIALEGANIEYNPSNFYLAVAGGKALKSVPFGQVIDTTQRNGTIPQASGISSALERELYMARIGYGKKDGGHFIISAIRARDHIPPKNVRDSLATIAIDSAFANSMNPKDNYMLDFDASLNAVPEVLKFNAQATGSLFTQNLNAPTLEGDVNNLKFVQNVFSVNSSSNFDYALTSNAVLTSNKTGTEAFAEVRYIGPGYFSLGSPNSRNDVFSYEAKARQSLMNNQMVLGLNYKKESDNLLGLKSISTGTNTYGADISYALGELIRLNASYIFNQQLNENTLDQFKIDNRNTNLNLTMTTFYHLGGGVLGITNLNYAGNNTKSLDSFGVSSNTIFSLNQSFSFPFQMSASTNFNLSRMKAGTFPDQEATSADLFISHKAFKIWSNSVGIRYDKRNGLDSKTTIFYTANLMLGSWGSLNIRAEKNVFNDYLQSSQSYDENTLRSVLVIVW